MDIKHLTSDTLRRVLALTDKKEQLIKAVADVETQIVKVLKSGATSAVEVAEAVTPFKPKKAKRGGKSGNLKARILALLEAAGDEGLKVKEIAEKLGTKATSVSVWFSTTGKALTTKVEPGRYAKKKAEGATAKPAPVKSAKPARKVAKKKAVKPTKKAFKLPKKP